MSAPGQMWRVADIAVASGGCAVTPLQNPVLGSGYWLSSFDPSYGVQ